MRRGLDVCCTTCGKQKQPVGRSAPLYLDTCDHDCPGYRLDPKPGSLWPGETEEEFGYPISSDATEEVPDHD